MLIVEYQMRIGKESDIVNTAIGTIRLIINDLINDLLSARKIHILIPIQER